MVKLQFIFYHIFKFIKTIFFIFSKTSETLVSEVFEALSL